MSELAPNLSPSVLQALPQPVIVIDENRMVVFVNYAAESFFGASLSVLSRQRLDDLIAFGSPIVGLAQAVSERRAPMTEYRVRVGSVRFGDGADDRIVDVFASPHFRSRRPSGAALSGAHHGRQDRPATGEPRRGALRHRPCLDVGARDQEPAVRYSRRGATA